MPDFGRLARGAARRARAKASQASVARAERKWVAALDRGVPRPVSNERTHLGPVMDDAVRRVRARMLPANVDADYDLAYESFDLTAFLMQAPQLADMPNLDPLANFLSNGSEAKASPEVNFGMHSYLVRHPERAGGTQSPYVAWLKEGRAAGEIADPSLGLEHIAPVLGMKPAELVDELGSIRLDLQSRLRTGTLGEMFAKATQIEPLIGEAWGSTTRPIIPPVHSNATSSQLLAVHACQEQAGYARARVVLVISDPRWGAGRRAEGHIAHALTREMDASEIVVVYTGRGGTAPPGRFPEGVREVDFAGPRSQIRAELDQMRALVELLRSFHAEAIVNVNSELLYQTMGPYGRALHASERIFPLMFCNEQLANGQWVGLPLRYFYRCMDLVEGVLTDSAHLADWLGERHLLTDELRERVHVLPAPVDASIPVATPPETRADRRPRVYWAGRFDRQKRIGLVFEVARLMPAVDFDLWGESVLTRSGASDMPDNVRLHGAYRRLDDVDLSQADAWLYTSGWDGVPSQLLEVAMTGVPLVASVVGGTGEVVDDQGGFPVTDVEDPAAYVDTLRRVLADPRAARSRAAGLRDRLVEQRTTDAYAQLVTQLLLTDPASQQTGRRTDSGEEVDR